MTHDDRNHFFLYSIKIIEYKKKRKYPGQVLGQVFTRNGLKEVNYEKYKSVSFLYPIDYQQKKSYGIPLETLIIRGSLDHAQVGPLGNQAVT